MQYSAVLQQSQGFRRFVRGRAIGEGLTGYIKRTCRSDVELAVEGISSKIEEFKLWLHNCQGQGMFNNFNSGHKSLISERTYTTFKILNDAVRPFHQESQPDGVIRGEWSDNQFELLSAHSSNLYQGGSSRHSSNPRSSGSRSSSQGYLLRGEGKNISNSSPIRDAGARIVFGSQTKLD